MKSQSVPPETNELTSALLITGQEVCRELLPLLRSAGRQLPGRRAYPQRNRSSWASQQYTATGRHNGLQLRYHNTTVFTLMYQQWRYHNLVLSHQYVGCSLLPEGKAYPTYLETWLINSLWPSGTIWVNIRSGNGLVPSGTKPLPEAMLIYDQ